MDIKVTIWKTAPRGDKNQKSSVAGAANARSSMQLTHSKCLILITRSDNLHQGFIQMTSPVFLIMIPVRFHQTSQLAAMTQNLDGASGGWRDLDQNKAEQNSTKRGSYFDAQPSSPTQEVFINLSVSLPGQWIFLADNIPRHNLSPENWRCWCHVLGGVLCHSVSQHLTTEMYYAHGGTKVNVIPKICPPLHCTMWWHLYRSVFCWDWRQRVHNGNAPRAERWRQPGNV